MKFQFHSQRIRWNFTSQGKGMKVSIIIPVYNAQQYLRRTAGDLLRQSFCDMEVIFVDDGSTDGSGKMLDHLARNNERVRVIHQENGGTARARNAGIAAASGEYLMFMDDDDRMARDHVREYVTAIERSGADIVIGGYRRVTPDGRVLFSRRLVKRGCHTSRCQCRCRCKEQNLAEQTEGTQCIGQKTANFAYTKVEDTTCTRDECHADERNESSSPDRNDWQNPGWLAYINISPWAKIYRRSFVLQSGAHFLEYPYGEDIYFQMMLLAANPKIAYISSVSYGWVDRKESISNTIHKGIRKEADIFPMLDRVLEAHPGRDEYFRYFLYRHCAYHIYMSGREADPDRLVREYSRCRGWLKKQDLLPVPSPLSPKLKGEILRDRIAVMVIRWTARLHLEKIFARMYCRSKSER